jgi:hypothetical protein
MGRWSNLAEAYSGCWNLLLKALSVPTDPLRTPVLGVSANTGAPHLRTLVLREIVMADKKLYFFTDLRSAKIALLRQSPMASLLFYHPEHKFQMVLYGSVTWHHQDDMTQAFWQKLPVWGRRTYATLCAPGTVLENEGSGLPDFWRDDMALAETESAYQNFAVLVFQTTHWEALSLHREGNQRVQFREPQGTGEWLVP